ncbi:PLP-dependent aminotransferase family protein [Alloacidobacterium dinghuense]|uniref:PLP-dependent aminotransferase family protein n=2 Tax=Alloacidobacterium dinghuense TaxID=2763107 RepID=A0A7G8BDD1_9BACT|nr:PLP-dependent aminotransferase family protein [Alloacidobacterium dinghuense]
MQLKKMVQSGELRAGERIPSSRELAATLHISRNTVIGAYDVLMSEGYLESEQRSGVYVGRAAQAFQLRPTTRGGRSNAANAYNAQPNTQFRAPLPFRPAQPDVRLFPIKIWNRHRARVLKRGANILHYQSVFSSGLDSLRHNIAEYLRDSRGVCCDWREIAITSGSQQALFLLAHLLIKPGDRVCMEDPGYLGARLAWKQAGAQILSAPIDDEGICLPLSDAQPVSLIYVTPSRQFPLGTCMSLGRRLMLLQTAIRLQTWIVEDDYDSEFRYKNPPLPSLQNLDENRRVIYVGTFSKILFPALRIGYAVLPPELVDRFASMKHIAEDHGPLIDQAALSAFMDSGAFHTHLRRCRRHYAERQQSFLDAVARHSLPLRFPITDGGMNIAGLLPAEVNDFTCSDELRFEGLDIPPLSKYAIFHVRPGLLFGFTAFDPRTIRRGVEKLARVLDKTRWPVSGKAAGAKTSTRNRAEA